MKTRDRMDEQVTSPAPERPRGISRLAPLGAILVVLLVVGASAVVFAQLSQYHNKGQPQSPLPPSGSWVQALKGYAVSSIAAANSTTSTLYICATKAQTNPSPAGQGAASNTGSYTILRSTDFGAHWRDVGSQANLGLSCQLAINPSNSNELYAVGTPDNGQTASVLRHSSDGGQSWETIQPTLNIPSTKTAPAWNVRELSMVGTALFGVQWLPQSRNPAIHSGPLPPGFDFSNRLVTSTDGGHTWTALDQQFASTRQSVSSYAVDPSNTSTIYELVSLPFLPLQPKVRGAEPASVPPYGTSADLYKTTDGGANWHALLQKLPFGAQVHLAAGNPQLLYVGGAMRPLPIVAPASNASPGVPGAFHLQVSSDGGATWRNAPDLPANQAYYVPNWFVSASGQVYVFPNSGGWSTGSGSSSGPGEPATAVATPVKMPPATPQTLSPANTGSLSILYQPALTPPPSGPAGSFGSIQRYSPTSNAWSEVAKPPTNGALLAVTPGDTHADVLWFAGYDGQSSLYRYITQ